MRLGIFGGSFDPVHYGHLLLAEFCREQARLDEVWFAPAAVPPHKQNDTLSPDKHRVEMLRLAIGGHEAFVLSLLEIEKGGVNYTYETLERIREERPGDELFFLMGADSLADLPTWRKPERICELATPVVVARPGSPPVDFSAVDQFLSEDRIERAQALAVEMPLIELSSTAIRTRVREGQSIRYQTPAAVVQYIAANGLYAS